MSWLTKRGHPTPNSTPGPAGVPPPSVPMYNPNQHFPENQWQQPQQQSHGSNWYDPNQQQQQQQQQQNYNQHYQYQNYQQQQDLGNLQYNQQYNAQNNVYSSLQASQSTTNATEGDAWNWGWGDEDNSNVQINGPQSEQMPQQQQQQQSNLTESFSNTTWDWSLDGGANNTKQQQQQQQNDLENCKNNPIIDQLNGKRNNKLETPQWSVESQMSQESSDDILPTTSESDKSYMLSQSSTISHSPTTGQQELLTTLDINNHQQQVENKEIIGRQETQSVQLVSTPPPPPPPPQQQQQQMGDDVNTNPYKRQSTNKLPVNNHQFPPSSSSSNFPNNQSVNLETLPDNSEQPDTMVASNNAVRKVSLSNNTQQQWLENNETPINDRNQYLETGQLSTNIDTNNYDDTTSGRQDDTLPPPGLRRMVLGQIEQHEPLPNFSRMVPGQLETSPNQNDNNNLLPFVPIEPPEGLRRMIPGESSSPESTSRAQQQQQQIDHRQDDSGAELIGEQQQEQQERSATIGADTPPNLTTTTTSTIATATTTTTIITAGDRSATIGADTSTDLALKPNSGRNNKKNKKSLRRDSIEGQLEDKELINSIKNLTVIDDDDDSGGDDDAVNNKNTRGRRLSRQDSSESEQEHLKTTTRDHRRYDDRYSPADHYHRDHRDRKYDRRRYKERRYDDDNTDYYSDKDRNRRYNNNNNNNNNSNSNSNNNNSKDDRDYDRKYDSLRKDKGRRYQNRRDTTRRNDYYRYDDTYDDESRSRASSRSDSIHDSYRERGVDRDRDRGHHPDRHEQQRSRHHREKERSRRHHHHHPQQHHDVYNPYQAFGYDVYSQYYQQYQYYENLRKTDPQAYAQFYRKYYQEAASRETPSYSGEGRASVHSGRSSANDELIKDSYARTFDQTDQSLNYDDQQQQQRMTPMKFTTAHIKATISSGKLIKILPNYPLDGQAPIVELCNLDCLLTNDDDYQELKQFPGPLIKGVTHKKTIIEYCECKIKEAYNLEMIDPNSYILMWELLILLIRQNGMVVGTDIAELLLKDRDQSPPTKTSSIASNLDDHHQPESLSLTSINNNNNNIKEEEITNKFREYLLYGSCKEALEWAMKHGLWGHALFLASKLDKRTYANVLMRFANGLTMNDPLQTLYQLLSGKIPAAVTCVADEKWGDWRPHLAMILSNSTQRPELNCKAITILGDTLLNRGNLYAAQFCYLMAESGFGRYDNPDTKLVLLGLNHHEQQQQQQQYCNFATNEAIHMTEIYEYACSLNDDHFVLNEFQRYKYLLATRLADVGLLEKSLAYLERISKSIENNNDPQNIDRNLIKNVVTLADRLKFYDPAGVDYVEDDDNNGANVGYGANLDTSRPDNSWLKNLKEIQTTLPNSAIDPMYDQNQIWQQQQQQQQQYESYQQQWTDSQIETTPLLEPTQQQQQDGFALNQYQDQSQYWQQPQQWSEQTNNFGQETVEEQQQQQNYYSSIAQTEDIPTQQPQISMPNQHNKSTAYNEEPLPQETTKQQAVANKTKTEGSSSTVEKSSGNGWFGGIFSKLSLKPKNQMKLPDDKNPSIVWDPEKKRWINTEEENGDGGHEFKPPPKMMEFQPKTMPQPVIQPQQQQQIESNSGKPPIAPQGNMFKLQRGRNLKKSYIDVFNPNAKQQQLPPPGGNIAPNPTMNFFIPQPVNDPNAPTDFLTPSQPLLQQYDDNSQQQ